MDINDILRIESLINELREEIADLPNEERLEVFYNLTKNYCRFCGCNNPNCQCWNDD